MLRRLPLLVVLVLPLFVGVTPLADAQDGSLLQEPLEYGTDVRHDPFDYTEPTDLITDKDVAVGVTFPSTQPDGMAQFRAVGNQFDDWYVSPVWMTFPHHVDPNGNDLPDADGGALHDQYDGLALPIDASTFTHVSMRIWIEGTPEEMYLDWFACQEWLVPCRGRMVLTGLQPGWNTVMTRIEPVDYLPRAWSGQVYGVRLAGKAVTDHTLRLDWFRLYEGASGSDPYTRTVATGSFDNGVFYNSSAGYETPSTSTNTPAWGELKGTWLSDSGSRRINLRGLPPGRWHLHDDDGTPLGEVTIVPRPRPEILQPDAAGGVDYATEVLGNPWDFEDADDAVRVGNADGVRMTDGALSAVNTNNDPFVVLPLSEDGLDPVHYHRVTVDQHYDSSFNLDDGTSANNPVPGGSHGRLLWRTAEHPESPRDCRYYSDGREMVFFKYREVYTYGMRDVPEAQGMASSAEPNIGIPPVCVNTGPDPHWSDGGPLTFLRFDPHESPTRYRWYVDDLRIAADDAADPTFEITWRDAANLPDTTVEVRLDDDQAGYDGELLATVTQVSGVNRVLFDATDRLPGTYWVNLVSRTPDGRVGRDYATGPLQVSPRIASSDRIGTAVEVSRQTFASAPTAVLASSRAFPDALVAVQLADAVAGPVLLTDPRRLDRRVTEELQRLGIREVLVAGGETAVRPAVATALDDAGFRVTRLGGETRYETAARIAEETLSRRGVTSADRVLVTTGENFPDALASGPLVGHGDLPLLLVRPTAPLPPPNEDGTQDPAPLPDNEVVTRFLDQVGASRVDVVGGPVAVSKEVAADVAGDRELRRVAGDDRYETAQGLADLAVEAGASPRHVLVSTGKNFPDALSAGPAAVARGGVLVLSDTSSVPPSTRAWLRLRAGAFDSWRVVGGPVAVSHAAVRSLRAHAGL